MKIKMLALLRKSATTWGHYKSPRTKAFEMRKSQRKGLQVSLSPVFSTHTYLEDILALAGHRGQRFLPASLGFGFLLILSALKSQR